MRRKWQLGSDTTRTLAMGGLIVVGAAVVKSISENQTQGKVHRVFISHSWKYSDHFHEIKSMLDDAPGVEWYDHSVTSNDPIEAWLPNHLRKKLRDKIRTTNIVIVLAGMYTAHSAWMEEEIKIATSMGKPIVGIIPPGNERAPRVVQDHADEIVRFERREILRSIRKHLD